MYENHLKRAEALFGKLVGYDEADAGEKCVILIRKNGGTYASIQAALGNPSKKGIRQVLLKGAPELIDLDCNYHKLKAQPTKKFEKQLVNKLNKLPSGKNVETEEDFIDFEGINGRVKMSSDIFGEGFFTDWDEVTQQQILNSIL